MAGVLDQLEAIRAQAGEVRTTGLDNDTVCHFVSRDPEPELRAAAARGLAELDAEALRLAAATLCKLLDETATTPQ